MATVIGPGASSTSGDGSAPPSGGGRGGGRGGHGGIVSIKCLAMDFADIAIEQGQANRPPCPKLPRTKGKTPAVAVLRDMSGANFHDGVCRD
jgi:hypothetical protein